MAKKQFESPSLTIEELTAELYLSKKDLKKANDMLVEQEKNRTELFANLSHDLRSPITALRNSIDYIQTLDEYTKEELQPIFNLMQNRILTLETLINNLFLLTTLENTAIPFHFEPIGIGMFLEDFFFNCEADKKYDNRELVLDVPLDMDA
ncbi:MAG: HAMP domain-containing histidine kinase, partial [Lachnospiraceae bacterium]|nr:HAMP domain-containing histidine kinase [Lachnospiraceae bacterium]